MGKRRGGCGSGWRGGSGAEKCREVASDVKTVSEPHSEMEGRLHHRGGWHKGNGRRRTGTPGETRGLPRAEGEGESCTRDAREVEGGYEKRWSKFDYITRLYRVKFWHA